MIALFSTLALTLCAPGPRDNCVVDGDTFWRAGEKIRLADIATPEIEGKPTAPHRAVASAIGSNRP